MSTQQPFPWHLAPSTANYGACDADGEVRFFRTEPTKSGQFWHRSDHTNTNTCYGYSLRNTSWQEHWAKSMHHRPENKNRQIWIDIPWHLAPDWANHAAWDEDGQIRWFDAMPDPTGTDFWLTPNNSTRPITKSLHPYTTDVITTDRRPEWKTSVTPRPKEPNMPEIFTELPWHLAPPEANFGCWDNDGQVVWFRAKPKHGNAIWFSGDVNNDNRRIAMLYDIGTMHPYLHTEWRTSLTPRPKEPNMPEIFTELPWHLAPNNANFGCWDYDGQVVWFAHRPERHGRAIWFNAEGNNRVALPRETGRMHRELLSKWEHSVTERPRPVPETPHPKPEEQWLVILDNQSWPCFYTTKEAAVQRAMERATNDPNSHPRIAKVVAEVTNHVSVRWLNP